MARRSSKLPLLSLLLGIVLAAAANATRGVPSTLPSCPDCEAISDSATIGRCLESGAVMSCDVNVAISDSNGDTSRDVNVASERKVVIATDFADGTPSDPTPSPSPTPPPTPAPAVSAVGVGASASASNSSETVTTATPTASTPPPCGDFLYDQDLTAADIETGKGSDEACVDHCRSTPDCNAVTRKDSTETCYLKNIPEDHPIVSKVGFTSYILCPEDTSEPAPVPAPAPAPSPPPSSPPPTPVTTGVGATASDGGDPDTTPDTATPPPTAAPPAPTGSAPGFGGGASAGNGNDDASV